MLSQAELQPGVVGSRGVEPGFTPPRTGWITVFLEPGGQGRNRTDSSTRAGRDRCLSCHPREWTGPDLNREPPPCHGGALPVGASSPQPPLPGTGGRPGWARGRMWGRQPVRPRQPGRSWSRTTRSQITGTASTRPRDTMRWRRWNWRGLNPRPLRCERSALPSELQPRCLGCPGSRRGTPGWQAVTSACRCVRVPACCA